MFYPLAIPRHMQVNLLLGSGHFLSHFYGLCLPPLFLVWQKTFGVSFAELGLALAVMSTVAALMQTPMGYFVDRFGARPLLIGGTLVMTLAIAAMGLATSYWQIVGLGVLSGIGNSVFHPCDYAILSGSVERERLGRSFAFHTFTGNVGWAAAPPVTAALMLLFGWRTALFVVGLAGIPVAAAIIWQSRILIDQGRRPAEAGEARGAGTRLLLSRSVMLFFAFFMVSAMAGAGIQSWLITILHQVNGMAIAAASSVLTGYMLGQIPGVLLGGWIADRTDRHLPFVVWLTIGAVAAFLLVDTVSLPQPAVVVVMLLGGFLSGASRTPRDVMVKDAAPPGQIGKVFGFVSSGMSLGAAIMPVPYGMIIDAGRPRLVLILVSVLMLLSLFCAGGAGVRTRHAPAVAAAD
jgi:MFS transporter, FSR family, fosmidomycin resistance protein